MSKKCEISGKYFHSGTPMYHLNEEKVSFLISQGILPRNYPHTSPRHKYVCGLHFNFPPSFVGNLTTERFKSYLKVEFGGAGYTCGISRERNTKVSLSSSSLQSPPFLALFILSLICLLSVLSFQ